MADDQTVLEYRVASLEAVVREVKDAVKSIDISLQTLARLEARHAETREGLERSFAELHDHETRIRNIESEMPTVKLIRNWVITGVVGGISIVGSAIVFAALK